MIFFDNFNVHTAAVVSSRDGIENLIALNVSINLVISE
jgi:hypothetical protein